MSHVYYFFIQLMSSYYEKNTIQVRTLKEREKKTFLAPTGAQGVRALGLVVKLRSRSSSGEGQVKVR